MPHNPPQQEHFNTKHELQPEDQMLISCNQRSGSAAVQTLLIRINLGGFPKSILTLISPEDVMSPANWFLPLFLLVILYFSVLMMEMKVVFVSFAFGKLNPGEKKKTLNQTIFTPL